MSNAGLTSAVFCLPQTTLPHAAVVKTATVRSQRPIWFQLANVWLTIDSQSTYGALNFVV